MQVDTAIAYCGWTSEEYLGKIGLQKRGLIMETKLYPTIVCLFASHFLRDKSIDYRPRRHLLTFCHLEDQLSHILRRLEPPLFLNTKSNTQRILLGPTQVFTDSAQIPEYRVCIHHCLWHSRFIFIDVSFSKIEMWYLHGPDRTTPYEATLKAVNDLHKEGYVNRSGREYMRY